MDFVSAPKCSQNQCYICDSVFTRASNMRRHLQRIHGYTEEEYLRETQKINGNLSKNIGNLQKNIGNLSNNKGNIKYHVKDHTDNNNITNIKCPKCSKSLCKKWYLTKHIQTCEGIKDPLSCKYCNKLFSHKDSCYKHYKICSLKKDIDSKALIPSSPNMNIKSIQPHSNHQHIQKAEVINNNNINVGRDQNNIQTQNVIVVYNQNGTEFNKDHIDKDAFIKKILHLVNHSNERSLVTEYGKALLTNPENKCIKKEDLKAGHSEVHIGDNKWETRLDKVIYPRLASDLANNLSELVYTKRNDIPKTWFGKIITFLDYMSDDGYVNTEDKEEQISIRDEFKTLAKELKLIIYDVSRI